MPTIVRRVDIENGSARFMSDRWEVTWTYRVVGPFNEITVLSAVDATTGLAVPQMGSPHSDNETLIVDSIDVDRAGYSQGNGPVHDVKVSWRSPTIDVLDVFVPEYEWDFEEYSETVDHDLKGRPFINTALDPIRGGWSDTKMQTVLRVYRQEPIFDVSLANTLMRRVNNADMNVFNYTVEKEQMICWSYKPTQRLRTGATHPVKTVIEFKFRGGYKPWQARFNNVGFNGYTENGNYGPLAHQSCRDPVSDPILLDGSDANYGKPLFEPHKYVVLPGRRRVFGPPGDLMAFMDPASNYPEVKKTETTPSFYQLFFDIKSTANFRNLIPGIM